jgi:hypothetical protein
MIVARRIIEIPIACCVLVDSAHLERCISMVSIALSISIVEDTSLAKRDILVD